MAMVKYRVTMNVRRLDSEGDFEPGEFDVLVAEGDGIAWRANRKAIEEREKLGLVVGLVFGARRLGVATVAEEMRDAGVPSLFEAVS